LLAGGDASGALLRLTHGGEPARDEDHWLIGWIGAAAALERGDRNAAGRWLAELDIHADIPTDVLALALVLVQRLRLRADDAAARQRASALLAAGRVPALEAALLRSAPG
jgi:uncharacterized protein HemY